MATRRNKSKTNSGTEAQTQAQAQATEDSTVENSGTEAQATEDSTVENSGTEAQAQAQATEDSTVENTDIQAGESIPICAYYAQNGKILEYEMGLLYKKTVSDELMTESATRAIAIRDAYKGIVDGYYKLLPELAKAYFTDTWSNFENIKNTSQLLMAITGCSSSTASEMVKVASTLYNSNGEIIKGYELFNYSDMIQLSKLDPTIRKEVRDNAEAIIIGGQKYNRTVLRNLVRDACIKHLSLAPKKFREDYDKEQRRIPKAEDQKPSQPSTEDQKPSQPSTDDQKPSQPSTDDQKPSQPSTEDQKPSQPSTEDQKPSQPSTDDQKPSQPSTDDQNNSDFSTDEYGVGSENPFDSGLSQFVSKTFFYSEQHMEESRKYIAGIKEGMPIEDVGQMLTGESHENVVMWAINVYKAYKALVAGLDDIDQNFK